MRIGDVIFVEMEDAERAHARVLAEFGGSAGYIDRGRLESAVHAARNGYFTCAGMFLRVNGYPVRLDIREWEALVLRVAEGRRDGADLDQLRRDVAAAFVQVMGGRGAFDAEP